MPYAPKDPKTNAAGCAERKPFSPADFFSTLLGAKSPIQKKRSFSCGYQGMVSAVSLCRINWR